MYRTSNLAYNMIPYDTSIGKVLSTRVPGTVLIAGSEKPMDRFRILDNRLRVVLEEWSGWLGSRCAVTFGCRFIRCRVFFTFFPHFFKRTVRYHT